VRPSITSLLNGRPVELYEKWPAQGVKRLRVSSEEYRRYIGVGSVNGSGERSGSAARGGSEFSSLDLRRRRAIQLWAKFADYMHDSLGKTENVDANGYAPAATITTTAPNSPQRQQKPQQQQQPQQQPCVIFYQRLEPVGIWGFENGGFQVCVYMNDFIPFPLSVSP
jgi:hypothetical protein